MKAELISIATDTIPLDGLFYEASGPARGGAILMHGNTMNFYVGSLRFLPPALTKNGIACLAYNRRGHDVLSTRNSRDLVGGAFQTVAEAIEDNVLAARWMGNRGFAGPIVIGHSHGGMLAAAHAANHPETPALVLLSAHLGGPSLMRRAPGNGLFGQDRHAEFETRAKELVAAGRGGELILLPGWYRVMTAASLVDAVDRMPSLLDCAAKIACPVLFIRGDQEPADTYPAEEFAEACAGPCTIEIVDDCDHYYNGCENVVSRLVAGWLDETLA